MLEMNLPKLTSKEFRQGIYKNKYLISFYDEKDENFVMQFDNLRQICQYRQKDPTQSNLTLMAVELYRALKREDHSTRMLGELMHVYLVDVEEVED